MIFLGRATGPFFRLFDLQKEERDRALTTGSPGSATVFPAIGDEDPEKLVIQDAIGNENDPLSTLDRIWQNQLLE